MEIAYATDQGLRRRNNEDACAILREERLFLVADGVGGNNSGECASTTTVRTISDFAASHDLSGVTTLDQVRGYFQEALERANAAVRKKAAESEGNRGMATTLVAAYLSSGKLFAVNVGDSRVYVLRAGKLTQITEDHTYVNTLVKAGLITTEEAKTHVNKNMITRAVGAEALIRPDFYEYPLETGDIVILCSDGLYEEVTPEKIKEILSDGRPLSDAVQSLIASANDFGGYDNISVICVKISEEDR